MTCKISPETQTSMQTSGYISTRVLETKMKFQIFSVVPCRNKTAGPSKWSISTISQISEEGLSVFDQWVQRFSDLMLLCSFYWNKEQSSFMITAACTQLKKIYPLFQPNVSILWLLSYIVQLTQSNTESTTTKSLQIGFPEVKPYHPSSQCVCLGVCVQDAAWF